MEPKKLYELFYGENGGRNWSFDKFFRLAEKHSKELNFLNNKYHDRILLDYSIGLAENYYYRESIPRLNESIKILEKDDYQNDLINKKSYLKELKFRLGEAYHNLNEINKAQPIFEELVKQDSRDDRNKEWLKSCIKLKYQYWINRFWIISAVFVFSYWVLRSFPKIEAKDEILSFPVFICLVIIPILALKSRNQQRKIK